MKIRSGFVSNSSSSSFIVAVTPNKTKISITIEVDLEKYSNKILINEKQVLEYFESWYGDLTHQYVKNLYEAAIKAIKEGKHVLVGSFANDTGDGIEYYLCDHGIPKDSKDIEIIHNESGY